MVLTFDWVIDTDTEVQWTSVNHHLRVIHILYPHGNVLDQLFDRSIGSQTQLLLIYVLHDFGDRDTFYFPSVDGFDSSWLATVKEWMTEDPEDGS